MKKIGEGWYYDVFDLGNGRVVKKKKSYRSISSKFSKGFFLSFLSKWLRGYNHSKHCSTVTKEVKKILQENPAVSVLLGNPKFIGPVEYEQDVVRMVNESFSGLFEQDTKIIDAYIESILSSWKHGFADRIFNFTINNGFTTTGTLILIDFNEVTFSKEEVLEDIQSKRWQRSWSATQISKELCTYYFERMEEKITTEALEKYWK